MTVFEKCKMKILLFPKMSNTILLNNIKANSYRWKVTQSELSHNIKNELMMYRGQPLVQIFCSLYLWKKKYFFQFI